MPYANLLMHGAQSALCKLLIFRPMSARLWRIILFVSFFQYPPLIAIFVKKAMGRRKYYKDIINHCYHRAGDGGVIFYTVSDYLVWFTIVCTKARKYKVTILAMCPMPDHVHLSVVTSQKKTLSAFMSEYAHDFAVEHNVACCRKGDFFQHPFGSVPKVGAKKARSNIIYIANNPVERQLVEKAEEYRWTFLTYAESDHPFSEKLVRDKASQSLRRVLDEVDGLRNADRPLNYAMLKRFFKKLDRRESLQLTDYIISKYNVIDYDAVLSYFDGNYRAMLTAIHSTTGSEYDLNEPFVGKSDAYYNQMTGIILRECGVKDIHAILSYDMDRKYELFLLLRRLTRAPSEQIGKYLHMPIKKL